MKQVTKEKIEVVSLSEIGLSKIYGFITKFDIARTKGFILLKGEEVGASIQANVFRAFTIADQYNASLTWFPFFDKPTLIECAEELINKGFHVFEFENKKELFKWLSE